MGSVNGSDAVRVEVKQFSTEVLYNLKVELCIFHSLTKRLDCVTCYTYD